MKIDEHQIEFSFFHGKNKKYTFLASISADTKKLTISELSNLIFIMFIYDDVSRDVCDCVVHFFLKFPQN